MKTHRLQRHLWHSVAVLALVIILLAQIASAANERYIDTATVDIGTVTDGNVASLRTVDDDNLTIQEVQHGTSALNLRPSPNSDAVIAWASSSGCSGAGLQYTCIDDNPDIPPDGNTTYISALSNGTLSKFNFEEALTPFPASYMVDEAKIVVSVRANSTTYPKLRVRFIDSGTPCQTTTFTVNTKAFTTFSFVMPDCNGPWTQDKLNSAVVDVTRQGADIITITRIYVNIDISAPIRVLHLWLNTTNLIADVPSSFEWNCETDYDTNAGPYLGAVFIEIVDADATRRLVVDALPGACDGSTQSLNLSATDVWSSRVHFHMATIIAFSEEGPGGEPYVLGNVTIDMFRIHVVQSSAVAFSFSLLPLFAFLAGICLLIVAAVWIRDRRH